MKWCELGPEKTLRFEILTQFLKKNSLESEFQFIECKPEEIKTKLQTLHNDFDVVRIHPAYYYEVSQQIDQSFREYIRMGSVDTLIKSQNKLWPENLMREAVFQLLTLRMKSVDTSQEALVIGSCGLARSVVAALVKLGFSKLNVSSESPEMADKLAKDFTKMFFNTHFKITPKDQLTLLPGVHGIVLNTFSFEKADDFLNDLYFFNFLKKGGWVLDFADVPLETPLIHVAKDIGAKTIAGYEINSFFDLIWVEKVFGKKLDLASYQELIRQELDKATFDKEKYKKILDEFQM